MPDELQARQATPEIFQVSSSKYNAKKITTRERGPFHQSITAILTEEKREEKQFTVVCVRECVKDMCRGCEGTSNQTDLIMISTLTRCFFFFFFFFASIYFTRMAR